MSLDMYASVVFLIGVVAFLLAAQQSQRVTPLMVFGLGLIIVGAAGGIAAA